LDIRLDFDPFLDFNLLIIKGNSGFGIILYKIKYTIFQGCCGAVAGWSDGGVRGVPGRFSG
jgi:hypothetical protein